jgi:hypothetical protein
MTPTEDGDLTIRAVHLRDLNKLAPDDGTEVVTSGQFSLGTRVPAYWQSIQTWYSPLQVLNWFPNPLQNLSAAFVAESANVAKSKGEKFKGEKNSPVHGLIQVSPFNRSRSTWRVDRVVVRSDAQGDSTGAQPSHHASGKLMLKLDVASQLLRHCFETILEAHTWISETDVNDKFGLSLYRQSGFQPLAHVTYWSLEPEQLQALSEHEPDLPNLLPVSNADAQLLYQLETVSMPPLVRQVFDHQIQDFRSNTFSNLNTQASRWMRQTETVSAYVFEPQRKAAIGYFQIKLCRDGSHPHAAKLTVHPAYTWLYRELMAQMAHVVKGFPAQSLTLASLDYQTEREEFFRGIGALEEEHTILMSRSVWHKVRESKTIALEGLSLPDVLQGLQPTTKPIPGRFSWQQDRPVDKSDR